MEKQPSNQTEEPRDLYGKSIEDWTKELTGDNLDVPSSRYGRNASEVAPWAVASMVIYNAYYPGENDDTKAFAEYAMSQVVNDADDIMEFVLEHSHLLPKSLLDELTVEGGAA